MQACSDWVLCLFCECLQQVLLYIHIQRELACIWKEPRFRSFAVRHCLLGKNVAGEATHFKSSSHVECESPRECKHSHYSGKSHDTAITPVSELPRGLQETTPGLGLGEQIDFRFMVLHMGSNDTCSRHQLVLGNSESVRAAEAFNNV